MEHISFRDIDITSKFWRNKQNINANVSIDNIYKRFNETGRFAALNCNWTKGDPFEPHIFWDSDIAKWIESVAYIIEKTPRPDLEMIVDEAVDIIAENQEECGYYNCCYLSKFPDKKWSDRTDHELYCAGHLTEAAVAYYKATGKSKLLEVMEKYINYIYDVFVVNKSANFVTPGHEEIELALVKLFNLTGNEKYRELANFFIDNRGINDEYEYPGADHKYSQSHMPVRQQRTAEGHSVRAAYLYSAMADLARLNNDNELFEACDALFDDICNKKMYITGGIGSSRIGEAFTVAYDLPNLTAYSESCAALALAWFAGRMSLISADSKYADVVERIIYNNGLSSVSLDGKSFFYENPLEIRRDLLSKNKSRPHDDEHLPIIHRKEVFDCSCCPPNITRFIASIGDFIYSCDDSILYVHQYMDSVANINDISITQKSDYPNDGMVKINVNGIKKIALRIPAWCNKYEISLNNKTVGYRVKNGYVYLELTEGDNEIILDMEIIPKLIYPSSAVHDCIGKAAVMRGPIVYCAEGIDNEFNIMEFRFSEDVKFYEEFCDDLNTYVLTVNGYITEKSEQLYSETPAVETDAQIRMIPYFAFANREASDMEVYLRY